MNYQETVILKESREYKAAEALKDSINSMSWNPKKFGLAVSMQHRTLQQSLMKSFVAILHVMASDDYGYDDSRGAHEAAKKIVESGFLDDIYLPFI